MSTLKFKTNIKCGGCIATVSPYLNDLNKISSWEVDIEDPDRILKVNANEALAPKEVINALEKAGYKAEAV